jgi:hypothetical protein
MDLSNIDPRPEPNRLFANLKTHQLELLALQESCRDTGDDGIYRFYHTSFKVYWRLQPLTLKIIEQLRALSPREDKTLNDLFEQIIASGTGHTFDLSHNQAWAAHTRPIVEAFMHARWFLDQLIIACDLEYPPSLLPEGWAAVLHLYNLR